jgi:hypothetical protein
MEQPAREAIILLMKGLFERSDNEAAWEMLVGSAHGTIADYFDIIGLEPVIDETEGYAFLRQKVPEEGEESLPRLIPARELGYKVSLLCVLLRKRIADFDMQSDDFRAVVTKEELVEQLLLFMPQTFDEVKLRRELDSTIKKVEELGFLKKLRGEQEHYEIRRSLKAFVDAQWLADFDQNLQAYREAELWQ